MSTFIDRLFNHRVKSINQDYNTSDPKAGLLDYLLDLATESARLIVIRSQILDFKFPEEIYLEKFCILKYYLELENYLINNDSRYLGTAQNLRQDIKEKFPEIANSYAFLPLYLEARPQEICIIQLFLVIILYKFKDEDPERYDTQRRIDVLLEKLHNSHIKHTIVEQINNFRHIKEESLEIHRVFGKTFGQDFVDSVYDDTKNEFLDYYTRVPAASAIYEVIPQLFSTVPPAVSSSAPPRLTEVPDTDFTITPPDSSITEQDNLVLENLLDGYILFDEDGRILNCNTRGAKIFDVSKLELLQSSIFNLFPDYVSEKIKQDIKSLYQHSKKHVIGRRIEIDLSVKNGAKETYEVSASNNHTSPVETFTFLLRNISKRKDTLKARISAEKAAEAKSTFLSNMSHEIRTPLNVILGLSEIISKSDYKNLDALRKNIDGISFSAKNLLSIVNDILDFSKIEAGKLSLQAIDFNLREVVYNISNGFQIKAREKGLNLSAKIGKGIPDVVIGDQYRLNQILTNLIGNALKFTQKGSIDLRVDLDSQTEEEIKLTFRVRDTGIGIAPEKLDNIFDSFYQVESPESAKINGTGLGLAITRELIQIKKGELKAKSKLGKGSEFYFTVPFKKSRLKKIKNSDVTCIDKNTSLEGLHVLVAEDNKMNQFYIKQLLTGLGIEVDIAENGLEAVAIYKGGKVDYDLILMDMHMPVMNGLEAISIIRQSNKDSQKKVPIVACSADVFPEARKKAIHAGIDFYLTKPLKEEALKEVLFWLVNDDKTIPDFEHSHDEENTLEHNKSQSVDVENLLEIFDYDKDFVISLLEVFINETPDDLTSLHKYVELGYYTQASTTAHKMKSSFMNLGMTKHGYHLQKIETLIKIEDKIKEAKHHLKIFEELYIQALTEVKLKLTQLQTS